VGRIPTYVNSSSTNNSGDSCKLDCNAMAG